MLNNIAFQIAPRGFSTLPEADVQPDMCLQFRNMFTNIAGNAEKRQGPSQTGTTVPAKITIDGIHEFIDPNLNKTLFVSGQGQIWRQNSDDTWTKVFTFGDTSARIFSMTMNQKFIFYNGVNRNVYTTDTTNFSELLSLLRVGTASSAGGTDTSANALHDNTVTNWTTLDGISQFSIVYYPNTSAAAMITSVNSAGCTTTPISAAGKGVGIGTEPANGMRYQIIDTLQVNVIPVSGVPNLLENKENAASGTTANLIKISAVSDWTDTQVRLGDYVFNSARNSLTQITSITTSSIGVNTVAGQTTNDKIYILKSSQPICNYGRVHYNRAYMIDARDQQTLRISGPNDPQDHGSSNAATLFMQDYQSDSDRLVSLGTFQRFFIIGTSKYIYVYEGTDPVGATSVAADWTMQARFPFGVLSRQSIAGVGNDVHVATINGIRNLTLSKVSNVFLDNTTSFQIDKSLRELLKALGPDDIQMFYYPKRSWVVLKAGSQLYVWNFVTSKEQTTSLTDVYFNSEAFKPAWHLFDGSFALASNYFVAEDGALYTGHNGGIVGLFDQGDFSDFGNPIETVYESAWLAWDGNPPKQTAKSITRKHGKAFKMVSQIGNNIPVTIDAVAPYSQISSDTAQLAFVPTPDIIGQAVVGKAIVGGNSIDFEKLPLRWHGEVCKIAISTDTANGPFVLSQFNIFYTQEAVE